MARQKLNPFYDAVTGLCVAMLLVSLAARFWFNDRAFRHVGPTHIAADASQVFIIASGFVHQLKADGTWIGKQPLAAMGVEDDPIDLRVADGDLVVVTQRPAAIRLCNVSASACSLQTFPEGPAPERQLKVQWRQRGFDVLWTDSRGSGLWAQHPDTPAPYSLVPVGQLAGPNDLAFDEQGHLWVADTDHRRIVEFIEATDEAPGADSAATWTSGRSHSAVNELTRDSRYFPMMLALGADGNWWVTQASGFDDGRADLMIYHPDGGAIDQVTLPGGIFATDIAAVHDQLLITDLDTFRVYAVDAFTREVSQFGDKTFQRSMAQLAWQQKKYLRYSNYAMAAVVLFGLLMIVAAVIATPSNRRWSQAKPGIDLAALAEKSGPVNGRSRGIHWLEQDEKLQRRLKYLRVTGVVLGMALVVLCAALFYWVQTQTVEFTALERDRINTQLATLLLFAGAFSALLLPLISKSLTALKHRLGSDGRQLHVRLDDGRELTVPPAEIVYTDRSILFREHSWPLQGNKQQKIYTDGELEKWIVPLLQDSRKVSSWQAFRYQWEHRNSLLTWGLFTAAVGTALVVALSFITR